MPVSRKYIDLEQNSNSMYALLVFRKVSHIYIVAAAEVRDNETGLISGQFSWSQSCQTFHEAHETKAIPISSSGY